MAARKTFRQAERDAHLAQVAARYLRGQKQSDIARELDVHHSQIGYDLRILVKRWTEAADRDVASFRAEQLQRINELEAAAWTAWENSRQQVDDTLTEQAINADGTQGRTRAQVKRRRRDGDPRFLMVVEKCLDQRARILGLYHNTPAEIGTNLVGMGIDITILQQAARGELPSQQSSNGHHMIEVPGEAVDE